MTYEDTWTDPDGVRRYKEKPLMAWIRDHIDLNTMWLAFGNGAFSR